MALSPILTSKTPFDSTVSTTFSFTYSGNQPQKNRLIIKKASDNTTVYDNTETTMQMYHTLIANTLTDGINYTAQLSVFDTNNVESPLSNTILFSCLSTPSFSFSNLTASQTINNSYYEFQLSYSQTQGELLSSYELYLYDSSQKQLNQTGLLYDVNNLKYTFANFIDKTEYYIRATGETVNGISLDTGLIAFNIAYTTPSMFAITQLDNLPESGQLKFTCNMKSITGTSNPSTPTYINNEKIDLTSSGSYALFNENFSIANDFTLETIASDFYPYQNAYEFSNGTNTITLKYMLNVFDNAIGQQGWFLLEVPNAIATYRIATKPFTPLVSGQQVYLLIRRIGYLYDIVMKLV